MVKINVKDKIIRISGHSTNEPAGKNIVCAAISMIIATSVSGIHKLEPNSIEFVDNGEEMTITTINEDNITKILLDNMLEMLQELHNQYPSEIGGTNE